MFSGSVMSLQRLSGSIVHWTIGALGASVNTLSSKAIDEWESALKLLEDAKDVTGLVISSEKHSFIVGADVKEFPSIFSGHITDIVRWAKRAQSLCNRMEELPYPTVAAIEGAALGGGLEFALAADYRLVTKDAILGLPEVTLGLCPGWGGSVRLTRLAGIENALPWILSGAHMDAATAHKLGVAGRIVDSTNLLVEAFSLLESCKNDPIEFLRLRDKKRNPITEAFAIDELELFLKRQKNRETASLIYRYLVDQVSVTFKEALEAERILFANLAKSDASKALIGLFVIEHRAKSIAKRQVASAKRVGQAAVIGAGIMGGGIAYQMAYAGVKTNLKDVNEAALRLGLQTASGYLEKQISRGVIDRDRASAVVELISPQLDWCGFDQVEVVVEAVVERFDVKAEVLKQAELSVPEDAILTSNTSTISIDTLAEGLSRPANFCGMHFFNPVPLMPLVEVIRGKRTSDEAVQAVVALAVTIGKQPIIVNDCPGFLVNRILFPYFNAFNMLLNQGVDCIRIDKVMEDFGWPMGPARLADVIGLDTLVHADKVLQKGFPDRMLHGSPVVAEHLLANGHLGRKNGKGFYDYERDNGNTANLSLSSLALEYLQLIDGNDSITDQEIIDRLMAPMCMEAIRCVDEGIVSCVEDADLGAIMGLGFPRFRGGPLRYVDQHGTLEYFNKVQKLRVLGPLYQAPTGLIERAKKMESLYA